MKFVCFAYCFTLYLLLTACGGGGGGDENNHSDTPSSNWQAGVFEDENTFVGRCAAPRTGINPETGSPYIDSQGSYVDENNWLRSWSNDKYLWYNEIVDRDPADYATADYFALLKTNALTDSGNSKDQFHFTMPTATRIQQGQSGLEIATGIRWIINSPFPPRDIVVAYVEPNSPAALAGVKRGDQLTGVDGYDIVNSDAQAAFDAANAALFPTTEGEAHLYSFLGGINTTLVAQEIITQPVLTHRSISTASGDVGYILFNDHIATAQDQLIEAINQLNTTGISDLILDLRYNSGGFIYIASQAAYMIAGANHTTDNIFGAVVFNDKHPLIDPFTGEVLEPMEFLQTNIENTTVLPSLNLDRVFVLTGNNTCSASELIINSLRGIDVEIIQIGGRTCGKPYGFYATDNCGTSYFSVNFRSENAKNYGDYADGFTPSAIDNDEDAIRGCVVTDDLSHALGDPQEARLAAALYYREHEQCPISGKPSSPAQSVNDGLIQKPSFLKNMIIQSP
ncbi:MAG: peptidase [Cellvibrionaceae bacterium]|nr:peptidase [Cellvibrionaceae bacterium]